MPNIEMWGFDIVEATTMKARIGDALAGKPYENECVVSVLPSSVTDTQNRPQPFVRLVSTDGPSNDEIIKILRGLHLDVEHAAPLIAFYPKK